ncbi:MAG: cytochrome d ubiquinol oxidase subunit II [Thermoleophilaceae bacterium]|nr:cytochrome d ubiquinol oxidase subunit II [Thermoleophilaceae bacterium]
MSKADIAAAVLWAGVTAYAIFGGADFGAGIWDLLAGGDKRGERPRELMDRVITPVWEANNVWLIFILVIAWSAFPEPFAAVMTTCFVPLSLAALGIVLRGGAFAFRKMSVPLTQRRLHGGVFAFASVLTPLMLGTVAGAIASGRIPPEGSGNPVSSWLNLTSITIGVLLVSACAYIAAVFLTSDSRRLGDEELTAYFRRRAIAAGAVAGALAFAGLLVLRADARDLYDGLVGSELPLVILSALCGVGAIVALVRGAQRVPRVLAALAVTSVVWGWGLAQHPEVLPGGFTIEQAAAPDGTMTLLFIVFGAAAVWVVPALMLLYRLHQRSLLAEPTD